MKKIVQYGKKVEPASEKCQGLHYQGSSLMERSAGCLHQVCHNFTFAPSFRILARSLHTIYIHDFSYLRLIPIIPFSHPLIQRRSFFILPSSPRPRLCPTTKTITNGRRSTSLRTLYQTSWCVSIICAGVGMLVEATTLTRPLPFTGRTRRILILRSRLVGGPEG